MKKFFLIPVLLFVVTVDAKAQSYDTVRAVVYQGDTIPFALLHVADVFGVAGYEAADNLKRLYILRRDVLRTYPYAKMASQKFNEMQNELNRLDKKKDKKRFVKEKEKELKELFEDDLKKLTVNQGKILMKLIDRETGNSSYEVIKELKGGFNAMVLQGTARMFGHNLKKEYDPEGADYMIEKIVRQIETGELVIPSPYLIKK